LWSFLKATYATPGRDGPPIYLGYGRSDRYAAAQKLLADLLPPARVTTVPGGHRWAPWEDLWRAFLGRGVLPGTSRATAAPKAPAVVVARVTDGTVPRTRRGR